MDRVRLAVEDNAKVFVLHMENMRNNKLKTKTRPSDIIEPKSVISQESDGAAVRNFVSTFC